MRSVSVDGVVHHDTSEPVRSSAAEQDESSRASALARFQRDPRHVRAVPTNAQLKIERALALFNGSEHPRTVAGIARSLGVPHVSATTSGGSAAEVVIVVAWELSWYRFVVDLSDTNEPVRVEAQGQELSELEPESKEWNANAGPDGTLALEEPETASELEKAESSDGEPEEQPL
jgi:hypothetical protein